MVRSLHGGLLRSRPLSRRLESRHGRDVVVCVLAEDQSPVLGSAGLRHGGLHQGPHAIGCRDRDL